MSSLRLRFIFVAAISIAAAIGLTGIALVGLFNDHIESELKIELEYQLEQITNNVRLISASRVTIDKPTDPKFDDPLSGRYWQVRVVDGDRTLSQSLWDEGFKFIQSGSIQGRIVHQIQSESARVPISVAQWRIVLQRFGKDVQLDIAVAADRGHVLAAAKSFRSKIAVWLSILAIALLVAAVVQIFLGLRPMETLRKKVEQIKSGKASRLTGRYPSEVVPLVDEVNQLLDVQDDTLRQTRTRAGDLAHGLNTPITILSAIARQVHKSGLKKESEGINEQICAMDRHVQHELSRARLAAQYVVNCDLVPALERVARTVQRIPSDRHIKWSMDLPEMLEVPVEQQDLSEVLGNVLDNARKWAKSRIAVQAQSTTERVTLSVEDDGQGVDQNAFRELTQRGRRLDDAIGGSGLGLAITKDIMDAYNGSVEFYHANLGGLGVRLMWPHRPVT